MKITDIIVSEAPLVEIPPELSTKIPAFPYSEESLREWTATVQEKKSRHPVLKEHFQRGLTTDILKPKGIEIAISKLKEHLPSIECEVCPNLSAFVSSVTSFTEQSLVKKKAFIIKALNTSTHITPVLAEINDQGACTFLLSDSFGTKLFDPGNSCFSVWQALKKLNCEKSLLIPKQSRQKDNTNCPVFSILDVFIFFNKAAFFESVLPQNPFKGDAATFEIDLPDDMLGYSQNVEDKTQKVFSDFLVDGENRFVLGCFLSFQSWIIVNSTK